MGRDIIFTIIVVWLVHRIYSSFRNNKTYVFTKKEEHHHYHNSQEGKVNIHTSSTSPAKSKNKDEGEYVDFEEIK